ncbi:hypothetical protein LSAT2_002782 [Lamellibrachia satsuma]|nr:hypothetical protein LSAT2_002782 [Lamellibrachia satsuma]
MDHVIWVDDSLAVSHCSKEELDERKLLNDADEGVTWQTKYFKYGDVVVSHGEDTPWVYVVKTGSLSVMTKLDGIRPQRRDDENRPDDCAWILSSRCRSGLHIRRRKTPVHKSSVLASSNQPPVSYKNQFDMLNKLEERIPGVYNVKKRLGLIDYEAIIAEEKLRLPRKLPDINVTQEAGASVLPPIGATEADDRTSAPERRMQANRLRLPQIAREKNIYLCIPGRRSTNGNTRKCVTMAKRSPAGQGEDIPEEQEKERPHRRRTEEGNDEKKSRRGRDVPPTFVRIRVLEKGQHFYGQYRHSHHRVVPPPLRKPTVGRVDLTTSPLPAVTVVSNGAQCVLLSKSFLSRHREDAMWKMCGKPDMPYPREDVLRDTVLVDRRWQAARRRIFDRLARRSRCRAALIRQFPPNYAGQYNFRTGPTPR